MSSFCVLLAALPLWPFYARLVVRWITNPNLSHCAWCGKETDKRDTEAIRAHIMECEKHPMRTKINGLEYENARLSKIITDCLYELTVIRKQSTDKVSNLWDAEQNNNVSSD
jgi:hypothetical protein